MHIGFNTILVPVDFSKNGGMAIKRAIALSEGSDAITHFINVPGMRSERMIINRAKRIMADLIIFDKVSWHIHWPWNAAITPARIAKYTGATVLMVNSSEADLPIKTIVVPVESQFSSKNLAAIHVLSRKFRVQVCLAAHVNDKDDLVLPNSLLQAYRLLKTISINNISYELLTDHNKEKAVMQYCKKMNADLLIVNCNEEPETV